MFDSADTIFTRGMIIPLDGDASVITFQWNPNTIIQDKKIKWQHLRVAGREQPFQQYGCGEARVFVFAFTVSRSNNSPNFVKMVQDQILEYTKPTAGGTVKRPPLAQLILGSYLNLQCIVRDVKFMAVEFYDPINLLPTSCEAALVVEEFLPDE
jgi:hypothetical protein